MKRSTKVEIALVAGLAMSGCGRRAYDPCAPQTFNDMACQQAVSHNGYYYGGHWYSHSYVGGYSSYYNSYHSYIGGGGRVTQVAPSQWSRPGGSAAGGATSGTGATSSGSVSHGVFGSTGHGSGGS
jgi:hypothetical protein